MNPITSGEAMTLLLSNESTHRSHSAIALSSVWLIWRYQKREL
jgi:hypothetical protein